MSSIDDMYNEEYDVLKDKHNKGEISQVEFDKQLKALENYCNEQQGLRDEHERWNVGRVNF